MATTVVDLAGKEKTLWVKSKGSSAAWKNFLRHVTEPLAKCITCGKELSLSGGSTGGLIKHYNAMHSAKTNNPPPAKISKLQDSSEPLANSIQTSMTAFVKTMYNREELIARLAAQDRISFNMLATSNRFRYLFQGRTFKLPQSHSTVRRIVMEEGVRVKEELKAEIALIKANDRKFSITLDEWTSTRNRRYMNVNVHGNSTVSDVWFGRTPRSMET
jgi:hypothetical protein